MEISKGIEIIGTSLFLNKEKVLIINDLHIGYEEALHHKGVLVPKFQLDEIILRMERIIDKAAPKKVVINGDLKHEFGRVSSQEWSEVLSFLDFLIAKVGEVIIIKGNHDPIINLIAEKRNIQVVTEFQIGKTLIVHGDELVVVKGRKIKRIIIGHEHPAITIRDKSKWEKYKCFLKGTWKRHELIAVPSFNPLLEGTDILKNNLLSPFLTDISNFSVFVVSKGEVYGFGKVKQMEC